MEEEFLVTYARDHGLLEECPGEFVLIPLEKMYAAVKAIRLIELYNKLLDEKDSSC